MEKDNTFFQDYQNLMNSFEVMKKEATNPFFKSKYLTLNQILPVVKQKCTENNFILMQSVAHEGGKNMLMTKLRHTSGEKILGIIEIISKDPNDPQKVGAGITYMRRYSLVTMFMLEDEDDDGNTASAPQAQLNTTQRQPQAFTPKPVAKTTAQQVPPPQPEYVPMGNTQEAVAQLNNYKKPERDEPCEKCGKPMVIRTGKYGEFLSCSGYPDCKNIRK